MGGFDVEAIFKLRAQAANPTTCESFTQSDYGTGFTINADKTNACAAAACTIQECCTANPVTCDTYTCSGITVNKGPNAVCSGDPCAASDNCCISFDINTGSSSSITSVSAGSNGEFVLALTRIPEPVNMKVPGEGGSVQSMEPIKGSQTITYNQEWQDWPNKGYGIHFIGFATSAELDKAYAATKLQSNSNACAHGLCGWMKSGETPSGNCDPNNSAQKCAWVVIDEGNDFSGQFRTLFRKDTNQGAALTGSDTSN